MKKLLSVLFILTIFQVYAFDRSQNPRLYEEMQANRETVYMPEFALGGSSSAGGSESVAASFIGQGNSRNNFDTFGDWSGSNGTYNINYQGRMTQLSNDDGALSLSDFSLSTSFTPSGEQDWPTIGAFITSSTDMYDLWFCFGESWDGKTSVSVNFTKFSEGGAGIETTEEGQTTTLIPVNSAHDIAITVINDTLVAEYNGTTLLSFTDAGFASEKNISIGGAENATLSNFTLKEQPTLINVKFNVIVLLVECNKIH